MNDEELIGTGCWQCGTGCPLTDETEPKLTQQLADEWHAAHAALCPIDNWPGADDEGLTVPERVPVSMIELAFLTTILAMILGSLLIAGLMGLIPL